MRYDTWPQVGGGVSRNMEGSSGPSESKVKRKEEGFHPCSVFNAVGENSRLEREFENTCMPVRN